MLKTTCSECGGQARYTNQTNLAKGWVACNCNSLEYYNYKTIMEKTKKIIGVKPAALENELSFIVFGPAGIKKNSRRIYNRRSLPSENYIIWAERCYFQLENIKKQHGIDKPFTNPLHIKFLFFITKNADLSNLYEGIQDCMQESIIIKDDSQIESHDGSRKFIDKVNPRIEVFMNPFVGVNLN